jgi:hypothetical protein
LDKSEINYEILEHTLATIKTELFENDGKTYEIHVEGSGWDYTVRAFLNGKPANGYRYSVSLPTAFDLRTVADLDAIKVLADSAKRDIKDKIWEQYVDAYIKTLSKTEDQTLGCRNCATRAITVSTVDERKMFECTNCGGVWYEQRVMTSAYLTQVDDITEGVERDGGHEIDTSLLLNGAFRPYEKRPSFEDQLRNWAIQNRLQYEHFTKKGRPHLRFWRNTKSGSAQGS